MFSWPGQDLYTMTSGNGQSIYFVENQSGINPHDNLTSEENALIIRSHVIEGLKLAHKHKLPLVIRDCIRSHHGNGPVRYFYSKYALEHPGMKVPDSFFTKAHLQHRRNGHSHDGRDAVEASSRV